MQKSASADIVIFGGGIAGLWLLNRLRQTGLSVILFETNSLGGGQTNKAQGIIHGGMKYALQGVMTNEAKGMSDLPAIWQACFAGKGEIDLSHVEILSTQHLLWAPNKLTAKIGGFLAGAALNSNVSVLKKSAYPTVFQHEKFKGEIYSLDEMVVNVPSLIRELVKSNQDVIYQIDSFTHNTQTKSFTVLKNGDAVEIKAQHFIFTSGKGNELLADAQRRPLHMVLVKTPFDFPLYAHCLGIGARPRITITTHYLTSGETIWYLGGAIAEEGVKRNSEKQIKAARKELSALFPWLDFSTSEFSTFMIDRAEPKTKTGMKPESSFSQTTENVTVAWPTKLAFAPKLADEILQALKEIKPKISDIDALHDWPRPPLATPVWEEAFCRNVV